MNARHIKYGKTQNLFFLLVNFLVLLKYSPQTLMKKKHIRIFLRVLLPFLLLRHLTYELIISFTHLNVWFDITA